MKQYQPLEIVKYQHEYDTDFSIKMEYQQRLNNASAVVTQLHPLLDYKKDGRQTAQYPLFFIYTAEMVKLFSKFNRNSWKLVQASQDLPEEAVSHFLDNLLLDEIINTNSIEGVETDATELSAIIKSIGSHPEEQGKRLGSMVRMYQDSLPKVNCLQDFRDIYDELLRGEIPADKQPNGQLFRDELPYGTIVIGSATKIVHVPPVSELAISEALISLISFMNKANLPAIFKALITHFFFENTHPFLDGNGRMGRYLLSAYLSSEYDRFTGFSVSTAIHAQLPSYYRIFQEADRAENRAELTFFVEEMLRILAAGQEKVLKSLR